jgi:diguanylate cyclase (GGDEF)-like protein/PAS domain S-box-containing protein
MLMPMAISESRKGRQKMSQNAPVPAQSAGRLHRLPLALLLLAAAAWAGTLAASAIGSMDTGWTWLAVALSSPVLISFAIAMLPGAPPHASGRGRTLVDGLIVGGSALFLAWMAGLSGIYEASRAALVVQAVGFVVVASGALVMLTRARPGARGILRRGAFALVAIATASGAFVYVEMGDPAGITILLLAGWAVGWPLLAWTLIASERGPADTGETLEPGLPTHPSIFIPSVPFAIGVLAAADAAARGAFTDFLIWVGAAVLVLLVGRQILALVENISFWRRLEAQVHARTEELERSELRFRSLVQHSSDVISLVDKDGRIRYQSPAAEVIFGYPPDHFETASAFDFVHPSDREHVEATALSLRDRPGDTATVQCRLRHRDGSWRDVEAIVTNLLHDAAVRAFVVNTRDVTERKERERLTHQAFHDPLTNLANRALFSHRVEEALARRSTGDDSMAILFLDLDDFKEVNDTYGHLFGDEVLKIAAKRLVGCVRSADTLARYGGDEFAVLVEGIVDAEELTHLARRLLAALEPPLDLGGRKVPVSASIGIARFPDAGTTSGHLLRSADLAMYAAKSSGKSAFRVFEPKRGPPLIESALAEGEPI